MSPRRNETQRAKERLADREETPDDALDTVDVSPLIGVSPITLHQWRARGEGPKFFRVGKRHIRYRRRDVIAWIEARTVGGK